MSNKVAISVTSCARYRSDEEVMRLAQRLALEHGCSVYVGVLMNEDTGTISPGFVLEGRSVASNRNQSVAERCIS
jgi:hypothetical protein